MRKDLRDKMEDIGYFKKYLQAKDYDKARLMVDFILDIKCPYYEEKQKLILYMFSMIQKLPPELITLAYTTIYPEVKFSDNNQLINPIIMDIINGYYNKALKTIKGVKEKGELKPYENRFIIVLDELLHLLIKERKKEENLLTSLFKEEKWEEMFIYLMRESSFHRLSRFSTILFNLLKVYFAILKEGTIYKTRSVNANNFNDYLENNDYEGAFKFLNANIANDKNNDIKKIILELLRKINQEISLRETSLEEEEKTFKKEEFSELFPSLFGKIEEDGLIILAPASTKANKDCKRYIEHHPNTTAFKIGGNEERLAIIYTPFKDEKIDKKEAKNIITSFKAGHYDETILLGRNLLFHNIVNEEILLLMAISYLRRGMVDLGTTYLNCMILLGKRLIKNAINKNGNYWVYENILNYFNLKEKEKSLGKKP